MDRSDFEPQHLGYIDTLRGIAFLAVLSTHTAGCVGHFPLIGLVGSGYYGVQLFFLASAITLCYSSSKRVQLDRYPWAAFFLRRLFRIAPLFWMAMIFYWTCPHNWPEFLHETDPHPYYFVLTALFLHGWRPETINAIVPGGWSIAVEMTFYFFFPLCFFFINSLKKAAMAVLISLPVAGLGALVLRNHFTGYSFQNDAESKFFEEHWFLSQAPTFLIGFALYQFLRSGLGRRSTQSPFFSRMLFVACLAAYYPAVILGDRLPIPAPCIVVFILAGFILAIASNSIPYLINPLFCYVGKISFSCYLVHFAMLVFSMHFLGFDLHIHVHDAGSSTHNLINFFKLYGMTLTMTLIAATATFHWIEQPGVAIGRQLIHWLNHRPETARSVAISLDGAK